MHWLDQIVEEQRQQRELIERVIAPVSYEEICNVSEQDEVAFAVEGLWRQQ